MTTMRVRAEDERALPTAVAGQLAQFEIHPGAIDSRSLAALVEREVIPRLMVAHAVARMPAIVPLRSEATVTADDVAAFVPLALQVEADQLIDYVGTLLARGIGVETLLVDLLAPAARVLGEDWEADRCDFVAVTMGLWRLQQVVNDLATRFPRAHPGGSNGHRALFAAMPGDQHSFGTVVIDDIFHRGGWQTVRLCDVDTSTLLRHVADGWFDLVGLTVSCDCHIGPLASIIAGLRSVSRNPRLCVMVGGRVFAADPALAQTIGADGTAPDATRALQVASALVLARTDEVACG